ncbi:MAG: hypothetical protein K1X79_02230 [Oligoflexia bacterium]|nr:hypothetical protein [Oligoflexia bacterium]
MTLKRTFCAILSIGLASCSAIWPDYAIHLKRAEELSRQEKYDEAIAEYREHMKLRLSLEKRPDWENPYLYLLMIGDIQLARQQIDAALATFELAEKNHVDNNLISDRYRAVASWYEKHDQLNLAIDTLKRYRDRDPLLFDSMLDRLAKELVHRENLQASNAQQTKRAVSRTGDRPQKPLVEHSPSNH